MASRFYRETDDRELIADPVWLDCTACGRTFPVDPVDVDDDTCLCGRCVLDAVRRPLTWPAEVDTLDI